MNKVLIYLKEFLQGMAVGIANIIPGFSGGTMAVIFHIYERILRAFSEFFRHPIKILKDMWAILIGVIVGICFAIIAIVKLLEIAPIPTVMLFVGLIIGSVPYIFLKAKSYEKIKLLDIFCFIIAVAILVILPFIKGNSIEITSVNFGLLIVLFVMGLIASATMIIPGVSGSLVLLAFGYYFIIVHCFKDLLSAFLSFNFTNIIDYFLMTISFFIGAVIGLVFISKLIRVLLNKFPRTIYWTIFGLLIASPFSIIYAIVKKYPNSFASAGVWTYIISFITLSLGIIISGYFSFYDHKKENKELV